VIFVLKLFTLFHFEVVYHLSPLVSEFDGHGNADDACVTVVTVAEVEGDLVDAVLVESTVGHLVQHDLALLGDDVLALAPQGGEDLEVVLLLGHTQFVDDTAGQHGLAQAQEVVLVHCYLDDLVVALLLGHLLQPLNLEFTLLLFGISNPISLDDQQFGETVVVVLLLGQTPAEQA